MGSYIHRIGEGKRREGSEGMTTLETGAAGYATARDYLLDELKRIDLVLLYHVQKFRMERKDVSPDEFRGLYISEEEIDDLFSHVGPISTKPKAVVNSELLAGIRSAIDRKSADIRLRKTATAQAGLSFPLDRLAEVYSLDRFEREALLISLALEFDLKYERIFAYLQDNVTKRRPTVDLLLTLLCAEIEERIEKRSRFLTSGPLPGQRLLHLFDEPGTTNTPLLARNVKVDEGIVGYLLGEEDVDPSLEAFVDWKQEEVSLTSVSLEKSAREPLENLIASLKSRKAKSRAGLILHFMGYSGAGKQCSAHALASSLGCTLLVVDGRALIASEPLVEATVRRLLREATLKSAVLFWRGAEALAGRTGGANGWRLALCKHLPEFAGVMVFGDSGMKEGAFSLESLPMVRVRFPVPSYGVRRRLWDQYLKSAEIGIDSAALALIASRFRFTEGQIREVAATSAANRLLANGSKESVAECVLETCRAYSRHRLVDLAIKVPPQRTWDDIILPRDQMCALREIKSYVANQAFVFEEWGFGKALVLSKGINVLFAGPSGTGKTMAAEILAGELSLDLYRIDLATVVSKYIGETEKNLDRIFREAEHSNAVLFFDEADAIFGKRSEIRDSHDRYANIEISYLLQKMEAYDGIAILATNLLNNLDDAFIRRMQFTVEFPMPEREDRLKIWNLCFPKSAPMASEIDLESLADRFPISGGNIKNIAVASAFHAVENGGEINMASLIHASKREFQKMGKLMVESDFWLGGDGEGVTKKESEYSGGRGGR